LDEASTLPQEPIAVFRTITLGQEVVPLRHAEGFRACLFAGSWLDPMLTVVSLTGSALVFTAGVVYFRRAERRFADII
jgi:ABC-type polysaccharide/polyol phosphate export permease